MSTNRTQVTSGPADIKAMPKGPNGRALCRRCGTEVPVGRRTFCSNECVDEWRIRTDPGFVRLLVFKRDRGVCAACGADTVQWEKELRQGDYHERQAKRAALGIPANRYSYWDADHIVPVIEGGGECDLDNIRTLCIPCHRRVTAELKARLATARRATKAPKANPRPQMTLPLDGAA